ncbi:MAG: Ig-like domain-containing protein, partial [Thermoplasmata archaeon]|nr:Ig-like domain-containing protein [Thermoplasmata archaeon]
DSMRFCIDGGFWGNWINFQGTHFLSLPDEDGMYTIGFSVRDIAGNEAVSPETLVVVMDRTPPTVVLTDPADEREGVPVDQVITVEVSEAVDVSTLTGMNFLVQDDQGRPVTGVFEFIEDERTITFTPDEDLDRYTTYSVMMRGEITDLAGNQLNGGNGQMWTFTTDGVLPEGPTGVSALPRDVIIEVSWDTIPNTYSGDLQGYNVYRMTDDGAPGRTFEFRGSDSVTIFIDDDVEVGVPYHYQITAFTTCGEGEASGVVSAIISPHIDEPEEPIDEPEDPEPVDVEQPVLNIEPDERSLGASAWMLVLTVIIVAVAAAVLFVMKGRKD